MQPQTLSLTLALKMETVYLQNTDIYLLVKTALETGTFILISLLF
jgi:hypothetical protein